MRVRLALVLAAAVMLAACGGVRSVATDTTVARVNGETITRSALESRMGPRLAQLGGGDGGQPSPGNAVRVEQLQRQTLAELIQDRIVADGADELGVIVSQQQVDERLNQLAERYGGMEGLRQEIQRRGRTVAGVREQLRAVIRSEQLASYFSEESRVTDAEVRQEYEQRVQEGEMRVADVSHILVETREEASAILDQLEAGADFAGLAEEHSIDEASAVDGGDLGESRPGRFVDAFDDAVWSAQEGDIIGPVQTEFGFHVIYVRDFRQVPLDEVRDEIRNELSGRTAQQSFDAWYQEALASAEVSIEPRFGEWNAETGRVLPGNSLARLPTPGPSPSPSPGSTSDQPADQTPAPAISPEISPGG